jgi:ABC-type oligopeptide transport system substrate-binding subunit
VHFLHIADAGAELRQYRAGEIDITYVVPAPQFQWIKQNLPDELRVAPQLSVYYYGFNLTRPPFKDNPKLRRALSMAIDRDRLTCVTNGAPARLGACGLELHAQCSLRGRLCRTTHRERRL